MRFVDGESEKFALNGRDRLMLVLFIVAVAVLMGMLAFQASRGRLTTRSAEGYYPLVTDALLSGQLHLKVEPRPELLKLADPYNSAMNQPFRMIDLSLYRGHYYFYWGLTPVVLLFAPFRLVTGHFPTEALACAFFGTAALGCIGWLILVFRRRYLPDASLILTVLALGCVAVASFLPLMATSSGVYGVPIAAAAFCQALLWCCMAKALHFGRHAVVWTAGAGLALGLSIGARPNYVLWSIILIWPLVALCRKHINRWSALVVAAGLPPLLASGAMLCLNWIRFGQWTEFGMHYQLTGPAQPAVMFSWANILRNWSVYAWNPPNMGRLFPFVTTVAAGPFGVFSALPVVFGVVALLGIRAAKPAQVVTGTIALAGVGGLLATCAFFGCGGRYQIDYLPAMVTGGAVGLLWWSARPGRVSLRVAGSISALALMISGAVALFLQLQAWGSTGDRLLPFARLFNRPVFWIDDLAGRTYGPLKIELELPRNKSGAFEPLLTTGDEIRGGEVVFLNYLDGGQVRVGFFQVGTTHWLSEPMTIDFGRPHRLDVQLGTLNPPDSHPVFAGQPASRRSEAVQNVQIAWDGQEVYRARLDFGLRRGEHFTVGENRNWPGISGAQFTGKIIGVRQLPFTLPADTIEASPYGPWRIKLKFPKDGRPGRYDPLLISGVTGAADFVNVFYPEPGKIAFSHDAWGLGGSASAAIPVDFETEHTIEIDHGGLYPHPERLTAKLAIAAQTMRNRLRITLDGAVVMDVPDRIHLAPAETVTAGENRLGGSTTAARFSGVLISAQRTQDGAKSGL